MGADTFICGECQTTFHDINAFIKHKNTNCQQHENIVVCEVKTSPAEESIEHEEVVEEVRVTNDGGTSSQTVLQMVDDSGQHQTIQIVEEDDQSLHIVEHGGQEFQLVGSSEGSHQIHLVETSGEGDGGHHIQIMNDGEHHALQLLGTSVSNGSTVQVLNLTSEQGAALMSGNSEISVIQAETSNVSPGIELVPVVTTGDTKGGENGSRQELQVVVKNSSGQVAQDLSRNQSNKRKPGRPRKGMERLLPPEVKVEPKDERPKNPVKGKDGRLHCPKCTKTFGRLRHFNTHKCLGTGVYGVLSDEEDEENETDSTPDYKPIRREIEEAEVGDIKVEKSPKKIPHQSNTGTKSAAIVKKGRGRPAKIYRLRAPDGNLYGEEDGLLSSNQTLIPLNMPEFIPQENTKDSEINTKMKEPKGVVMADPLSSDDIVSKPKDAEEVVMPSNVSEQTGSNTVEPATVDNLSSKPAEQLSADAEVEQHAVPKAQQSGVAQIDLFAGPITKGMIPDLPVFSTEEEKIAFEETLNQIDMTQCDHLFNVHVIQQDVTDDSQISNSRTNNELSVFTCTVCDKVFKMLSHVRNHVLGHTDLKPFVCRLCEYSSNNKGNLYTHMRRHTGQLYRCSACSFSTCNKSHLIEHIRTHGRNKQTCRICSKRYTTEKSLINHIRKYHTGEKGQQYLNEFQGKQQKGPAVLHQCHVCNRKFKKKIDRDRHLFVHNIKSNDNVHHCDLCEYTASRRIYLEKHFRRHRVVYVCCDCKHKFSSTIRLSHHLNEEHGCGDLDDSWVDMFTKCIENSLFQPEPDAPIRTVSCTRQTSSGTELATIPETSLSAGLHKGSVETAKASELLRHIMKTAMNSKNRDATNAITVQQSEEESSTGEMKGAEKVSEESEDAGKENAQEEPEIFENEEESNSEVAQALEQKPNYDIYNRLEFVPLTMDLFHRLRQAFGNEECEYCGKLYYSRNDCQQHVKTHTGERPFHCDQCNYKSITKDQLKRHIEREHENIKYVCHQCDYVAPSRTNLWHHQQKHKKPLAIGCPICPEKFDSGKRLKIHMEFKHPEIPASEAAKIANANHKTNGKLGRKSFRCPYCDRQFVRGSSELQKHIWIHEGIKPFKCPLCPYACRSKSNLTNHLLRHSSEKPFLCIHCGKAYKSKTALRWHVRTHKDGKIFKCTKCEYEATQKSHLVRHMETHNVIKRFQCQHCDYSANTLGYIKIHYTRVHEGYTYTHNPETSAPHMNDSETKVYKCLSCDYLFGNLSDMKRHLKIRHHVQVDNLQLLEEDSGQVTQVITEEEPSLDMHVSGDGVPLATGQTIEVSDTTTLPTAEEDATTALQALQYAVPPRAVHDRTVDVLHQLLGLSQQGGPNGNQPITVQANDGQVVELNPDTIIVQQNENGEVVLTSSDPTSDQHGQYVIQYVDEDPTAIEQQIESEVVHMTSQEQQDAVQTIMESESAMVDTEQVVVESEDMILGKVEESGSDQVIQPETDGTQVIQVIEESQGETLEETVNQPMEVVE